MWCVEMQAEEVGTTFFGILIAGIFNTRITVLISYLELPVRVIAEPRT